MDGDLLWRLELKASLASSSTIGTGQGGPLAPPWRSDMRHCSDDVGPSSLSASIWE
jgi:hypothetical protein